jgi:hypothetical protein
MFEYRRKLQQNILIWTAAKVVNSENSKVWQHWTVRDSIVQTLKCRSGENSFVEVCWKGPTLKIYYLMSKSEVVPVHEEVRRSEGM